MQKLNSALNVLLERLSDASLVKTNVIPWSCPVPSFGDLSNSQVATLGLNPSNREFVDSAGRELDGAMRRFHTLNSLGLKAWTEVDPEHLQMILESCFSYFCNNPYDGWFKRLDYLISETRSSYYDAESSACHLDLIPYATECKWTELSNVQRTRLLTAAGDTLSLLLKESSVRILILNGNSVVKMFEEIADIELEKKEMSSWKLRRASCSHVTGYSYSGSFDNLSGIKLKRNIQVLGFNHNIQSSFGVTRQVIDDIKEWVGQMHRKGI